MRQIAFGMPLIDEQEKRAVNEVLSGPILVHGPKAKEFESDFCKYTKAPFATSVSSCTAALHLAYFYMGLGENDEVIVPAQTHTATAHAVELCLAKPVFVDAERQTGNIDISQIEAAITSRTKAISIVHFLGMPVDMDAVNKIAKKHHLPVVEDCALAMGTYYKGIHAGNLGDFGCFSFYPVKHMTTSEGGMLTTNNEAAIKKIERQKAFGVDRTAGERKIPGVYDVNMLGFNYRMSEIESVIGIVQLKKMNSFLERRRSNYDILSKSLNEISEITQLQSTHDEYQSSYYCLSVILNEKYSPKRFEIVSMLNERGIGTSVYYPRPVPHMAYYKDKYRISDKSFPNASWISYSSIALSVAPHLNGDDMLYMASELKEVIQKFR